MKLALALLLVAVAAPPSSVLKGTEGTLQWTVTQSSDGVVIEGRSPKWTVRHVADLDLKPRKTVRSNADGDKVIVEYTTEGATVVLPRKTITVEAEDLWDGDTLDIRLGALAATGVTDVDFDALDPSSGKVYSFQARKQGDDRCGDEPCTHVRVTLAGMLKRVGPKWHYYFSRAGQLLRFEGPIGDYAAEG